MVTRSRHAALPVRKAGWLATVVLVATVAASPLFAQSGRLSLSERVARLEQQADGNGAVDSNPVDLLNRISQLQGEVQSLRSLVEEQGHQIELLKQQNRDQYLAIDSRLTRLEGGVPAAAADGSPLREQDLQPTAPSTPDRDQLVMEPPLVQPPPQPASTASASSASAMGADGSITGMPSALPAPAVDERGAYESAFDSLKNGQYAEAARRFQAFLRDHPNGEYAPNAQYWLGESYYVTQNYQIALESFESLLSRFPNSAKAPDALLKVGYCHYELRQWEAAEAVLSQVIQQYPDTTVSRLAQGRLRALRLENRQ
ncbi:MAG: tol-pal system protein YbgF [Xanthomonadales bacterium]|nr:tol-pal system protein YbgF [Xanthomonadales bacterium]